MTRAVLLYTTLSNHCCLCLPFLRFTLLLGFTRLNPLKGQKSGYTEECLHWQKTRLSVEDASYEPSKGGLRNRQHLSDAKDVPSADNQSRSCEYGICHFAFIQKY